MKKISAVLLVLVLVGSVAFAGFTGSATTGFGYNMDDGDVGFITQSDAVSVELTFLEEVGEAAGEGDIYAEINATLSFTYDNADASTLRGTDVLDIDWEITSAKIIGDDWYVGILGALDAPNYAKSAIENKKRSTNNDLGYAFDENKTDWADVQASKYFGKVAGVEIGYNDYVASVGFVGNMASPVTYDAYGTLSTPAFEVGDGLTVTAGLAGLLADDDKAVSGSVKFAYEMEDVSVTVAADVVYDGGVEADVSVAAAYADYTLDVYYATVESYNKVDTAVTNLLSAKVGTTVEDFTVTVTGKDLLDAMDIDGSVKFQATEEMAVTARGGYEVKSKDWEAGADVEYAVEDYTAKLSGTFAKGSIIKMSASVESTTLVPGATLKLAWSDAEDLLKKGADGTKELGKILASVKIAF
ncbi:MAG: hypothetical protein PHR90_02625 [Sphaerochaetaceae bacterium]|nr:hypothetical protein [Sphaerochaetaceae bacterium]